MTDAPARAVDRAFPYDPIPLGELVPVGSEYLGADASREKNRSRGIGKRSGRVLYIGFYFRGTDGRLVPSKFGRVVPSADVRLAPLIARVALDAAAAAHKHGLLRAEDWERAGLPPPEAADA